MGTDVYSTLILGWQVDYNSLNDLRTQLKLSEWVFGGRGDFGGKIELKCESDLAQDVYDTIECLIVKGSECDPNYIEEEDFEYYINVIEDQGVLFPEDIETILKSEKYKKVKGIIEKYNLAPNYSNKEKRKGEAAIYCTSFLSY